LPTWGQILEELNKPENALPDGRPHHDRVRRKYLAALFQKTARPVIAYSTAFLDREPPLALVTIQLGDIQGFMNAAADIEERELDLIITSPGGYPEATESIVAYLRTRFDHIRAFVPVAAMSAATMLALGCDEIIMGAHSQLGPIDPQFTLGTPDGPRSAPGQAILDQFERAKQECAQNPQNVAAWMPILRSYAPGLLALCHDQQELAKRMVCQWLEQYMLRDDPDRAPKAARAAEWFADYDYFGSHGRRVSLGDVQALGLKARALEDDQELQDALLSVHHCFSLTHSQTPAAKIIENHLGRAHVKLVGDVLVQAGPGPARPQPRVPMTRAERRRHQRGR
jgi:hypothetical protein